jgi:hypothetical protein
MMEPLFTLEAEDVAFFTGFGFLVEGISPRRYQEDTAEFVLAKHLLRVRVADDDLPNFAERFARVVFSVPAGAAVGAHFPPGAPQPTGTHPR